MWNIEGTLKVLKFTIIQNSAKKLLISDVFSDPQDISQTENL